MVDHNYFFVCSHLVRRKVDAACGDLPKKKINIPLQFSLVLIVNQIINLHATFLEITTRSGRPTMNEKFTMIDLIN